MNYQQEQTQLLELASDYIIVTNLDRTIAYWNHSAEVGYGWSKEDAVGKKINFLLKSQYPKPIREIKAELFSQGYWHGEIIDTKRDGREIIVESRWTLVRDQSGIPTSILGINTDITEKKQMEKCLKESERKYRAIFDSMFQFMVALQADGRIIDANQASLDFADVSREDVINKILWDIEVWKTDQENRQKIKNIIKQALEGNLIRCEISAFNSERKIREIDFSAKPVFNDLGQVIMLLCEGRDITYMKEYEKEMAQLSRLNLIGQMAAGIGHEIRNPMTSIRGFLQILSQKEDCLKYKRYFDMIIEEVDRTNSIISEFLSLAKNKPKALQLNSINNILDSLAPLISADALKAGVNLIIEKGRIPDLLLDEKEIRQLVLNMVRNSLESTKPSKSVTIKTFLEDEKVVLSVEDQGSGISSEILNKIGTPFLTTKPEGVGLGLAVCYRIAERHNAIIHVKSNSSGTIFKTEFKRMEKAD